LRVRSRTMMPRARERMPRNDSMVITAIRVPDSFELLVRFWEVLDDAGDVDVVEAEVVVVVIDAVEVVDVLDDVDALDVVNALDVVDALEVVADEVIELVVVAELDEVDVELRYKGIGVVKVNVRKGIGTGRTEMIIGVDVGTEVGGRL